VSEHWVAAVIEAEDRPDGRRGSADIPVRLGESDAQVELHWRTGMSALRGGVWRRLLVIGHFAQGTSSFRRRSR